MVKSAHYSNKSVMQYRRLFSLVVAGTILWVLTWMVDWKAAFETFSNADILLILTGAGLTVFLPFIGATRWKAVLLGLDCRVKYFRLLNAVMIAFSANLFMPAKSGDLVKVLLMGGLTGKAELTAGVIAERMGDLLILGLFAAFGGLMLGKYQEAGLGVGLVVGIICGIFVVSRLQPGHGHTWLQKLWQIIRLASDVWINKPACMMQATCWSAANWGLAGIQIWLFFLALGENPSFFTVLTLFPITILVSLIPITPGGIGLRESAFVFLFLPYAEPHASIAVSLGYYLCNTGITALIGASFLYRHLNEKKSAPQSINIGQIK